MTETKQSETNESNSKDITLNSKREFHQVQTSTYWLPKDEEEQFRLMAQHSVIKDLFGGNILSSVTKNLDFNKELTVLDVGCGSGVWLMDTICEYPKCKYYGCDMVDVINRKLANFTFNIGNVLQRLPYPDNTFDFVHMRLFVFGLREAEWPKAIKEVLRIVKPGGFIQFIESDTEIPNKNDDVFYDTVVAMHKICKERGQTPLIGRKLEGLVREADNARVVEVKFATLDTTSNSSTAKRMVWNWVELIKGTMSSYGPALGLKDEAEQKKYLKEFRYCLDKVHGSFQAYGVVAQKTL
ncbi:hypothetical protein CU097_013822 [Rhizopus azygosporus]|uniref:Methyltransferase domain-containing protein n=1 Tax=Rhizopus azygosporus TaxID=86630 RepID=A0A367JWY7_RHIAZ|nr:hypothetical protein CU097_013822 [Rhizopus azygosporus]